MLNDTDIDRTEYWDFNGNRSFMFLMRTQCVRTSDARRCVRLRLSALDQHCVGRGKTVEMFPQ